VGRVCALPRPGVGWGSNPPLNGCGKSAYLSTTGDTGLDPGTGGEPEPNQPNQQMSIVRLGTITRSSSATRFQRWLATATRLSQVKPEAGAQLEALVLRGDEKSDLMCVNMMCEHVGGPCACKLARTLSRVPNLRRLEIPGHGLEFLPEALAELTKLEHLDVSYNRLTDLSMVGRLPRLRTLRADGNALAALPTELAMLAGSLGELSLRDNQFEVEPPVLASLREASPEVNIDLEGNACVVHAPR